MPTENKNGQQTSAETKQRVSSGPNRATLPNSVEAEQNVLCCILRNTEYQLEMIAQLKEDDFYQFNHREIFAAMQAISEQSHMVGDENQANTVGFASVVDYLRREGKLEQVGDIDYILKLNELLPSTANYDEYISIVKRASTMRKLIRICGEVEQRAYSAGSAEEAITYAEEQIFNLSQGGANAGLVSLADDTAKTMYAINERFVNPGKFRGIQTGFKRFDRMTNGLHGGELIVLAARPGVGKSAMAMNIVENVAKQGKTVAIYSLEMSKQQLIERMLSSMSTVPLAEIKSGQFTDPNASLARIRAAQNTICATMSLYGNDYAQIRPSEISSQCRRLKAQHGLDMIVIDYIQLMNSGIDPKQGRANEVGAITRALKLMAKELDVPIIALAQLKRDAEMRNLKGKDGQSGGGGEPVLSDLRESGSIEQDADIVLFIHREKDEEKGTTKHSLIVAKHRNGETGNIELFWLGKFVRFMDAETLAEQQIAMGGDEPEQQGNGELPDLTEGYRGEGEAEGGEFIPPDEGDVPEYVGEGESDVNIDEFEGEENKN